MISTSHDTDAAYFASLIDTLSTYPQSSLGTALRQAKAAPGAGTMAKATEVPVTPGPRVGGACSSSSTGQATTPNQEAVLVRAWQEALSRQRSQPPGASALADVIRRTEQFFTAVAAQVDKASSAPPTPGAVTSAVERVLTPLVTAVSQLPLGSLPSSASSRQPQGHAQPGAEERAAYARLIPQACAITVSDVPEVSVLAADGDRGDTSAVERRAALYAWLWRQAGGAAPTRAAVTTSSDKRERQVEAVRVLLGPLLAAVVVPLEKELRFHFQRGKDTAKPHEPQHFFTFLGEQLGSRLRAQMLAFCSVGNPSTEAGVSLYTIAETGLCVTAAALFQEVYQWSPSSPLVASRVFTVHTLNALFDLITAVEARTGREALLLLSRRLAFPAAVATFLTAALETANKAFVSAPDVLWRRAWLQEEEDEGTVGTSSGGTVAASADSLCHAFFLRSVHLMRCLESLTRRLSSTLLLADPKPWRAVVWQALVAPALRAFQAAAQDLLAVCTNEQPCWASLQLRYALLESVHLLAAGAEDWRGLLFSGAAVGQETTEVLDETVRLRDSMARATAEQVRARMAAMAAAPDAGAGQRSELWELEAFLHFMEAGPMGAAVAATASNNKFILETVLRRASTDRFTPEQRAAIHVYAAHFGLQYTKGLFAG